MELTKQKIVLLSLGLLPFFVGCSSTPSFPVNGGEIVQSESEFGVLTATPDVYEGRAIKLAGRIIAIESTENGTILLAEWLPFPKDQREGPIPTTRLSGDRFELFYPGKLDKEGMLNGNKFLVLGKIAEPTKGTRKPGLEPELPFINAKCLNIWKTGSGDLDTAPDVENAGYPLLPQTYCSET